MKLRRTCRTLARLDWSEWKLVFEAAIYLLGARFEVWFLPFRRLAMGLGQEMAESPTEENEAQRAISARIGWAVQGLGENLPWMGQCLVQAVAATRMLRRRRIPSTLYFGVAKDTGEFMAHAWVRSGTQIIIGAKSRHAFTVVATFAAVCPVTAPDYAPHQ